jgi:hypothetical protein
MLASGAPPSGFQADRGREPELLSLGRLRASRGAYRKRLAAPSTPAGLVAAAVLLDPDCPATPRHLLGVLIGGRKSF